MKKKDGGGWATSTSGTRVVSLVYSSLFGQNFPCVGSAPHFWSRRIRVSIEAKSVGVFECQLMQNQ